MEHLLKDRTEQLVDYIMKHCLWQFHSRAWDRERQNREILKWTTDALCGEAHAPEDRLERCHWVDGVSLAEAFRQHYPWINSLEKPDIATLLRSVHERMDFLTIKGSLNLELTDHHY